MTEQGIDAVAALAEPLRRRLYHYVVDRGSEISRAEAAEAVGAQRTLVAFHLDKLVEAGLLEVVRRKLTGRDGPGSGRPAKLYRRADAQHTVQLPPRDYESAARVLAEAVHSSGADEALHAAARAEGRRQGAALPAEERPADRAALERHLRRHGYEPVPAAGTGAGAEEGGAGGEEALALRNCPFHSLAREFPPLACGMNLELLRGLLEGAEATGFTARMRPLPEGCCVLISKTKND